MELETFLGCFDLETGGLVIGWLGLIGGISLAFGSVYWIFTMYSFCSHFPPDPEHHVSPCAAMMKSIIPLALGLMILSVIIMFIYYGLIKGTQMRDHVRVNRAKILQCILLVLCVFSVIVSFGNLRTLPVNVLFLGVHTYLLIVIHSLHVKFQSAYAMI